MRHIAMLLQALAGGGTVPVAPHHAPQTGRIIGNVALSSMITSKKMRFRLYADRGVGAVSPRQAAQNEMTNVVIYVDAPANAADAGASARPIMAQRDESFAPHILPVLKGTAVEFLNEDPYFHNVFSLSRARSFDLGRYPKGQSKTLRFDRVGAVRVFCHIHADMSAVVLVLDNALFASPDSTGHFELSGIPPGQYRLVAWHERAPPVSVQVTVVAGQSATADFSIPIPDVPSGH